MGTREGFIASTNPKINAEKLGKYLAKNKDFHSEYAPVWVVCKTVAVNDLSLQSSKIWGEKVEFPPIFLKAGTEALCIGYESFVNVCRYFGLHIRKDLVFVDSLMIHEYNYTDIWRDEPVVVGGKTYFSELLKEVR